MPEVNISGPSGRIEARYHHERGPNAPVALILHPHPQFGGTMNNQVVYHLYSMELGHGPLILRLRTANRTDQARLPSLTPVWRAAEFQEREIFDLFGIVFEGHPDLRRILMWDGFKDFPMRKDYVEPDDYEYEPTPHGEVLEKAERHYPREGS